MYALIDTTKESEKYVSARRNANPSFKIRHKSAENPLRNWPSFAHCSVVQVRADLLSRSENASGKKNSRITRRKNYQNKKNRLQLTQSTLESCKERPEKIRDYACEDIETRREYSTLVAEKPSSSENLSKVSNRRRFNDKKRNVLLPAVVSILSIVILCATYAITDQQSKLDDDAKPVAVGSASLADKKDAQISSNDSPSIAIEGNLEESTAMRTNSENADNEFSDNTGVFTEKVTANKAKEQIHSLRQENSLLRDAIAVLEGETLKLNSELLRLELDLVEANYLTKQLEESRTQTVYNFVDVPVGKGAGSTSGFQ